MIFSTGNYIYEIHNSMYQNTPIKRFGDSLYDYLTQFVVEDKNITLSLFCMVDIIRGNTKQYNHQNPIFILLENEVSNIRKYCKKHPNKVFKIDEMIKYIDLITKKYMIFRTILKAWICMNIYSFIKVVM